MKTTKHTLLILCLIIFSICTPCFAQEAVTHTPIELNGADWSSLRRVLQDPDSTFSIVHIGDSHLQADVPTAVLRTEFQSLFGNAGRGLTSPLKLNGTYEPSDYSITSQVEWSGTKFLKYPWTHHMWFSGTSLKPLSRHTDLEISLSPDQTMNKIQIFHQGTLSLTSVTDSLGENIDYSVQTLPGMETTLTLGRKLNKISLEFEADSDFLFHSISTTNGNPGGVLYHVIGNGGSDIAMYNRIDGFGKGISLLNPQLIILSMGTNDSYNNFSEGKFISNLSCMVDELRNNNPDAAILLVTPMEIQKKKRLNGRKKRYASQPTVVDGIATIHTLMLDFAKSHNIALYDWYSATGGAGASDYWVENELMRTDRIHLTKAGYEQYAQDLFISLREALSDGGHIVGEDFFHPAETADFGIIGFEK